MPTLPLSSTADQLTADLAARIARRDLPEPPDEHVFTPERVRRRIEALLVPLVPGRNARGLHTISLMLYGFLHREAYTAYQLANLAGVARVAGSHTHGGLVRAGLLRYAYEGPRRVYRLTRYGEDWLLAVARNEVPPAPPA